MATTYPTYAKILFEKQEIETDVEAMEVYSFNL